MTLMDMPYLLRVATVLLNTVALALAGWMGVTRW